jgi:SNF2 family DNA or RNA helicase
MIVEQRIGRVQRLASEHASVSILNIILRGTFEEYIVGRLMEKLQMACYAIGDMEALLEASGIDDDEENRGASFDEKILQLKQLPMELNRWDSHGFRDERVFGH